MEQLPGHAVDQYARHLPRRKRPDTPRVLRCVRHTTHSGASGAVGPGWNSVPRRSTETVNW